MIKYIFHILLFVSLSLRVTAGSVDTIAIYSTSMHKPVKCVFIMPGNYNSSQKYYPVIYLLHGYSGNYAQWINIAPQLSIYADSLQAILVCPDGGYGSWYFNSPVDTTVRYETFVSSELVKYTDSAYKTVADKQHRAITGLSMGGHGALYLSIRHKNIYGAAGATSGGVDIRPFPGNWDLKKVLGDTICCKQNWQNNTVINIADSLKNGELKIIFDCGVSDFFIEVNRSLHQKLLAMKIDHDYIERPGAHNKDYWKNSIDYQLLFFKKFFESSGVENITR